MFSLKTHRYVCSNADCKMNHLRPYIVPPNVIYCQACFAPAWLRFVLPKPPSDPNKPKSNPKVAGFKFKVRQR